MKGMEVGIKQAKSNLSKLVNDAQQGKRVFLVNRGKRVAELVPVSEPAVKNRRGLGMFKEKIHPPKGWGSKKQRKQSEKQILELMGIGGE